MELFDWAATFEDQDYKIVAKDKVGDVSVSTVWLGFDRRFGNGPPLIFETMVFGGLHDQDQARYATEIEAILGHAAMLLKVKQSEEPGEVL